jgi:hypothetical protein
MAFRVVGPLHGTEAQFGVIEVELRACFRFLCVGSMTRGLKFEVVGFNALQDLLDIIVLRLQGSNWKQREQEFYKMRHE